MTTDCPHCEQALTPALFMAVSRAALDTYRPTSVVLDQYLNFYHHNQHTDAEFTSPNRMPRRRPM